VHPLIKQADENYEAAAQREAEAVIRIIQQERSHHPEQKNCSAGQVQKTLVAFSKPITA